MIPSLKGSLKGSMGRSSLHPQAHPWSATGLTVRGSLGEVLPPAGGSHPTVRMSSWEASWPELYARI